MSYSYKASKTFWKKFYSLPPALKEATRDAWLLFKKDPFNSSLQTHKINSLSARAKRTIYSVTIADDLRVVFYIDNSVVNTVDIGNHEVYK